MAVTSPVSGSIIKLFDKRLIPEALKDTIFGQMVGSTLKHETELSNMRGKDFTTTLGINLTGTGFGLATPVDGNAESITSFTDTVVVDQLSQAVEVPTNMNIDQQTIGWEWSKEGFERLTKWFKITFEIWAANQLAGNTATQIGSGTDTLPYDGRIYTAGFLPFALGNNAVTAPSSDRVIRAGGAATDQALTSTDTMTLSLVEAAVEKARNATPVIEPVNFEGSEVFIMLVSNEQWTDLLRDTASAVQVVDIELAKLNGGQNPFANTLIKVKGFEYQDTLIIRNSRVPFGVNSSTSVQIATVRRAIFMGKDAASFGFKGAGAGEAMFHERRIDGGRFLQITANAVGGLKKTIYDGQDYGVITISTFAAAHTS